MSVADAGKFLVSKGFVCEPSKALAGHVQCIHGISNQFQTVDLAPAPNDPSVCVAVASLTLVLP
jgi:hypothetical protein